MALFWASTAATAAEARREIAGFIEHQAVVERDKAQECSQAIGAKLDELARFVRSIRYVETKGPTDDKRSEEIPS